MMKKAKTKAGSHKASLAKLANKRTNRLAKQGKLHKADKKLKKKKSLKEDYNKKQQQQQQQEQIGTSDGADEGEDDSFSDEDVEYFQHMRNAQDFLRTDLIAGKSQSKKRKRTDEDEEEEYEQLPRTFAADKESQNMKMMLPIIAKGKVIKQMMEKDVAESREDVNKQLSKLPVDQMQVQENGMKDDDSAQPSAQADSFNEKEYLATLSTEELFAYRKNKLAEKKQKIASLSNAVLEDPQNNMKKLKELRLMLGDTDLGVSLTVRKYAMVSLMEVFKDIVPGYRLRIPTEKEKAQRVKKETKSLWDYEASFLLNYKIYLEFLETMAKLKPVPDKSFLTKHGISDLKLPAESMVEFGKLALKCLCEMLVNHTHFNYRNNIISSLVPFTNHRDPQFSEIVCTAVKRVFKEDKSGEVTLEIIRNIGRMVKKRNFKVKPAVLETFLILNIKEVDLSMIGGKLEKMKRKDKMMKLSRRERKRLKHKEQLDKELMETKATVDKRQKLRLHTETIQAVFETYIRVIKLAASSKLLPAVLEGLAKFAHLINVEYFDSLFAAFNGLIESGLLSHREMLHCMQTAFTILSGQGMIINIDPSTFYKHFYNTLPSLHAGSSSETAPIVLECLDSMINKRRRQLSQQRIIAFMKRLCTLCLQQTSETAVALLACIRQFVHTYKFSDILFDSEVRGNGVYLPFLEDPEHCCATSTSLWELQLLKRHYCPAVQLYAKHLIRMAPLAGEHQLPQSLARKSPKDLYEQFREEDIFSKKPARNQKRRKGRSSIFVNEEFNNYVNSVLESVPVLPPQKTASQRLVQKMDIS